MAYQIDLKTHQDPRGKLTVIEKVLPFEVKRIYYMYDVLSERGGHRHKKAIQALVCINGSCKVFVNNGKEKNTFALDRRDTVLIVEPADWHTMDAFSADAVLMVISSEFYDREDYIDQEYPDD